MRCPFCAHPESKVLDSRPVENSIRRRRECLECGNRFTTYETTDQPMIVVKKDGTRQDFERTKLMSGLQRACRKRPVSSEMMIKVTDEIERELHSLNKSEIPTNEIGKLVMNKLKNLDEVAYVRFASVYLEFNDVKDFVEHIKEEF
ncbi:MAG: transcriptional regulator NrdR [Oscillospiraceae bacterium]|jgi:transcriptional repressor NrdR|nr:transcriptional regulator NrdR [Oscillospiraceae bacterium]